MTEKLTCGVCGDTTSSFFIAIGDKSICTNCKKTNKSKGPKQLQAPRIFTRYICRTHDCATYSVSNMMFRHAMKDCVIVTQQTLGIMRPATTGGINGDIGRNHYLGVNELQRLKTNLENYKRFLEIFKKIYKPYDNVRVGYQERKYFNKHLSFLAPTNVDYHKNDEILRKLEFNLRMYLESEENVFNHKVLTPEDRNNIYYEKLMNNFKNQVKK